MNFNPDMGNGLNGWHGAGRPFLPFLVKVHFVTQYILRLKLSLHYTTDRSALLNMSELENSQVPCWQRKLRGKPQSV